MCPSSFRAVAFRGLLHLFAAVLLLENNTTIVQAVIDPRRWVDHPVDIEPHHPRGDDHRRVNTAGAHQAAGTTDTVDGQGRDRAPRGVPLDVAGPGHTPHALHLDPHHRDGVAAIGLATPLHDEAVAEDVGVLVTAATTATAIGAEAPAVATEGTEVSVEAAMVVTGGKILLERCSTVRLLVSPKDS